MTKPLSPSELYQKHWNMFAKVNAQICRYYPNDERPAKSRTMAIHGPMLRLAVELGIRGWQSSDGPLSMADIKKLLVARSFNKAYAYVDFEIEDEESGTEKACLWLLTGKKISVQFISPSYRELQAQRSRDIDRAKVARETRKPKTPPKDLKTRGDII
jgi:hypothetical protein